jgi:hypothetical protein
MKKTLGLGTVLLLLTVIAYYLYSKKAKSDEQLVRSDRGFAVANMADVDKIVIKHVKLQPLVFTRNNEGWELNGKYKVDQAVFVHIERVLTNVRMLYVPPVKTTPTILKSLKTNGIQVDVYEGDQTPSKIIHIGSDTPDNDGTYMILGGSSQPYAMHLPGLAGGLRSRFEQPLENYRDKFIFHFPSEDIKHIKVQYPKNNLSSFIISHDKSSVKIQPLLKTNNNEVVVKNPMVLSYLSGFESLGAEKIMNTFPLKDSIISAIPTCIIELTTHSGVKTKHQYYPYDAIELNTPSPRSPGEIRGLNRMFVLVDSSDFYTVQNRVFGNIFRGYQEFVK